MQIKSKQETPAVIFLPSPAEFDNQCSFDLFVGQNQTYQNSQPGGMKNGSFALKCWVIVGWNPVYFGVCLKGPKLIQSPKVSTQPPPDTR